MNKRFLFRGKRIDDELWVHGDVQHHGERVFIFRIRLTNGASLIREIDPATIGQCTGLSALKSYRGTEPGDLLIYEGDLLVHSFNASEPPKPVVWDEAGFWVGLDGTLGGEPVTYYTAFGCMDNKGNYAVIVGNIYDHEHLLEAQNV